MVLSWSAFISITKCWHHPLPYGSNTTKDQFRLAPIIFNLPQLRPSWLLYRLAEEDHTMLNWMLIAIEMCLTPQGVCPVVANHRHCYCYCWVFAAGATSPPVRESSAHKAYWPLRWAPAHLPRTCGVVQARLTPRSHMWRPLHPVLIRYPLESEAINEANIVCMCVLYVCSCLCVCV